MNLRENWGLAVVGVVVVALIVGGTYFVLARSRDIPEPNTAAVLYARRKLEETGLAYGRDFKEPAVQISRLPDNKAYAQVEFAPREPDLLELFYEDEWKIIRDLREDFDRRVFTNVQVEETLLNRMAQTLSLHSGEQVAIRSGLRKERTLVLMQNEVRAFVQIHFGFTQGANPGAPGGMYEEAFLFREGEWNLEGQRGRYFQRVSPPRKSSP